MKFRAYHEMAGPDRSGLADQIAQQRRRIVERLSSVRWIVGVMSGKGGVGKSYCSAMLAVGAAERFPGRVGVLDADLGSPTMTAFLEVSGPLIAEADGIVPVRGVAGVRVISTALLIEDGEPLRWREPAAEQFVWRGALETGALREFISDVVWGDLDLLIVDLPPGPHALTDLAGLVPSLTGAFVVTIPTPEAGRSVARAMAAARSAGVRLLGVIENMTGYVCRDCGRVGPLFDGNAGESLCERFEVPLLARIPFRPHLGPVSGDETSHRLADACLEAVT